MGYRTLFARLTGLVFVLAAICTHCLAQDWPSNGTGTSPMPPVSPAATGDFQRPVVPGPPIQPTSPSRPATWPGAVEPTSTPWSPPPSPADLAPRGEITACGRIIARVGSDPILECDVIGAVNEALEANKSRITADQLEAAREMLIKQRLKGLIETKMVCQDARRTIPSERMPDIDKKLANDFDENELAKMMKKAGVNTPREFDARLRSLGSSLDRERRAYIERALAGGWMGQHVKKDEEVTYEQMVEYYHAHLADFTTPAKAQWEELMVRYSNARYPSKTAAYDAIAQMGNQVLGGAPFADVARNSSDGATAADGGQCGWVGKGGLVAQFDELLFSLPVGQLSQIIEGPTGYHIVRVIDRHDVTTKPFPEAQADIKKKITQQRTEKQIREYLAKLEARTPVWTIFEGDSGQLEARRPDQQRQR